MALSMRSKSEVWLVGQPIERIGGTKLPSICDVLRLFFFLHKEQRHPIREAARETVTEVKMFWEKARIPMSSHVHVREKMEKLFEAWKKLLKWRKWCSDPQIAKEKKFWKCFYDLFDITNSQMMDLSKLRRTEHFFVANGRRVGEDTLVELIFSWQQRRTESASEGKYWRSVGEKKKCWRRRWLPK